MHRVALFGGTFDPVHLGHVAIARAAHEAIPLDRVVFLPAYRSPHKEGVECAAGEHRAAMLELALADDDWAEVSHRELEQEGPSYSWKTAEHFDARLCEEHGEDGYRLYWIMGHDQWQALPRWSRPERLAELLEFIVFPRDEGDPEPREGFRMTELNTTHPASATAIRRALASGQAPEGLDSRVEVYARDHGLYVDDLAGDLDRPESPGEEE